jgi:hypothetical protein
MAEHLQDVSNEINEVCEKISKRAKEINADVMTVRNDPEIKALWNRLCLLHMKAVVTCEEIEEDKRPQICSTIEQRPPACVEVLTLSEEQSCPSRYFKRKAELTK